MSQALIGILSSFVSLGYVFQIFALLLAGKRRVKRTVTVLHMINQLAFALLYLVPFVPVPDTLKHVFFILFLLAGYILSNFIGAPKLSWYMTFVSANERGRFTAKKEIWSLMGGMVFSYIVSFVIDHFEATGQINNAFIVSAIAIFLLAVVHTLVLIYTPDIEIPGSEKKEPLFTTLKKVFANKRIWKVLVVQIIYNIISCTVLGFFGAYTTSSLENFGLGLSMTFISIVSAVGAVVRSLASRPMGRFADKYSFKTSTAFCYSLFAVALIAAAFMTPKYGMVFYTVYVVIQSVAMAGMNSGIINLLYEEVEPEQRMSAYAVQQFVAGFVGFLSTFPAAAFVASVQATETGTLLGLYAQQWLCIWGALLAVVLVLYVTFVLKKKKIKK